MRYIGNLAMLFFTASISAQTYSGALKYGKSSLDYNISLVERDHHISALFSSVEMNAYEIPCQNTSFKNDSLKFYVVSDYYTYEYKFGKNNENFDGHLKFIRMKMSNY